MDADVYEADEVTSTQTGIEVGVATIPAPPGWGKRGCGFGIEVRGVGFVMCVMCPVYPPNSRHFRTRLALRIWATTRPVIFNRFTSSARKSSKSDTARAQRLRCLAVYDQFEGRRLFDRNVGRLNPVQDFSDKCGKGMCRGIPVFRIDRACDKRAK